MNPFRPPYRATIRRDPNCVFCKTNQRRLLVGRPYMTVSGGVLTLDSVTGPVRVTFPNWLINRGRGGLAIFTYRPRYGAPVRLRQKLAGPNSAVVELPWRLR
jgi:hypothetical protein